MQHFQSILIVIGLLAIGGVLIHGYLLSRKDKLAVAEATSNDIFAEKVAAELVNEPVDEVLGDVRIVSHQKESREDEIDFSQALNDESIAPVEFAGSDTNSETIAPVEFAESDTNSETIQQENIVVSTETSEAERTLSEATEEVITEPSVNVSEEVVTTVDESELQQDLFIFNVVAKDDLVLGGHELLQFFLTSGFRFGEMSIFHRHEHSDGTGPVLFSIANMMAPGIFDPDNMEQFKSKGVSFFLTAPNKDIDVKASFEMMLTAVEQMAEEFDCLVLNAQREPMTEAQFIEYNHRLLHYI